MAAVTLASTCDRNRSFKRCPPRHKKSYWLFAVLYQKSGPSLRAVTQGRDITSLQKQIKKNSLTRFLIHRLCYLPIEKTKRKSLARPDFNLKALEYRQWRIQAEAREARATLKKKKNEKRKHADLVHDELKRDPYEDADVEVD